jgi:nicotinate-nucleotide--dimethylbenzimidazole phosphoribosyltransferase
MSTLNETIDSIKAPDESLKTDIQAHLDDLTKPQGSLGKLEDIAMQYCLVRGTATPELPRKKIFCFGGDHGVADEGVSAFPQEVTPQMVMNMLGGGAAINVLARHANAELTIVDMGVADPMDAAEGLCRRKVKSGTDNIAKGPAMTTGETTQALEAGIELAEAAIADGITLLGTGDMGIANTTPSTALFAVYLNLAPEDITGRGTGVDDAGLKHKTEIIKQAIAVNSDSLDTPLNILASLGGCEIAGICGLILGAAANKTPVVIDGFISTAGAVAAMMINKNAKDYMFFSHMSQEQGHTKILSELDAKPILSLDMRLGEGTGAALAMTIIEASIKIYNEMATFSSAGVSES